MTTRTSPLAARVILYGTLFIVRCTSGSSYLRPMRRLIEKMVFSGLVTACRLATWPTRRSPLLVIATTEGVSREPSLFSNTTGSPASMTAITELVVPRSMPSTFAIASCFLPYSSSSKPFTGKRTLMSTLVHAPEILLRQLSVGTVLLLGNMLGKQIDLLTGLTYCTFQVSEGSRHNNRLSHTLTSFWLIPPHPPHS